MPLKDTKSEHTHGNIVIMNGGAKYLFKVEFSVANRTIHSI